MRTRSAALFFIAPERGNRFCAIFFWSTIRRSDGQSRAVRKCPLGNELVNGLEIVSSGKIQTAGPLAAGCVQRCVAAHSSRGSGVVDGGLVEVILYSYQFRCNNQRGKKKNFSISCLTCTHQLSRALNERGRFRIQGENRANSI